MISFKSVAQLIERRFTAAQHAATDAVRTLVDVMNDPAATHAARVAAARTVLEEARRAAELEDLAERVATLEAVAPTWLRARA